ncbi:MAG: esterase-like activity of phytase family protein [Bacteroidota bacterium]
MFSRRRFLPALIACALIALLALPAAAQRRAVAAPQPEPIEISAQRVEVFERANPSRLRFGRLEFLGGLMLKSAHKDFGGLSDLVVTPDGRQLLAISDEGTWLSATISYDGLKPAGLTNARIGRLLGLGGAGLARKRDHDAESMALLDGTLARGTVLIGFERNHRIGRFPVVGGAVQPVTSYLKLPAEARRMRSNKGFEALTVMRGGAFKGAVVAISERFPDPQGNHSGWIWVKGVPHRFGMTDLGEFDVTSAAALEDGALLVLERRFRWTEGVKMRLRYLRSGSVAPGAVVTGDVLLEADMGYEIDNMEGLAVHRGPRGALVLTLISDNNFNALMQRTLLLQFALHTEDLAAAQRPQR